MRAVIDPDNPGLWRQYASCATDPELFAKGCGETVPAALRVCRHCPVAQHCVDETADMVRRRRSPRDQVRAGVAWSLDGVPFTPKYMTTHPKRSAVEGHAATRFTAVELEVLRGFSNGSTAEAVGLQLGMSKDAVKSHAARLYRKLGVSRAAQALEVAYETGLLQRVAS